jgi:hypothetical protein
MAPSPVFDFPVAYCVSLYELFSCVVIFPIEKKLAVLATRGQFLSVGGMAPL